MIEQRIKSLIEKRTIEAAKKEVVKKLHTIVLAFGKPIVEQFIPYNQIDNYWEVDAIHEIQDGNVLLRGFYFDGLRRGINLCIKLMLYDDQVNVLQATYNGYTVFLEKEGNLESYAPFPQWEEAVERLYSYAKPVEQEKIEIEKEKKIEKNKKEAISLMGKLRLLWGV